MQIFTAYLSFVFLGSRSHGSCSLTAVNSATVEGSNLCDAIGQCSLEGSTPHDNHTGCCPTSLVPRLLPSFLLHTVQMRQKAGEEPGNEARRGPYAQYSLPMTSYIVPGCCCTGHGPWPGSIMCNTSLTSDDVTL